MCWRRALRPHPRGPPLHGARGGRGHAAGPPSCALHAPVGHRPPRPEAGELCLPDGRAHREQRPEGHRLRPLLPLHARGHDDDQGGHALLRGAAGPPGQVRRHLRRLELRRHHVHPPLRLPALLRPQRRRGALEGAPRPRGLRRAGLEARLAGRQGAHPRDAQGEPERQVHGRGGPEPRLDEAEGALHLAPAAAEEPRGEPARLPLAEPLREGRAAYHRGPAQRGPDPGPPGDLPEARRQRRRPADAEGAEGGPAARRREGAALGPAGDHGQRGLRRQRRHRLHRVPGCDPGTEALPPGGRLLVRLQGLRPQQRRQDLPGRAAPGARQQLRGERDGGASGAGDAEGGG
mmetsp:Transcript_54280/g.168031  ORF Transcript_54280/g.168031 Transcript_54280/m.168031 type:complete len:348 (-) Transcript_54280:303-1346(-)